MFNCFVNSFHHLRWMLQKLFTISFGYFTGNFCIQLEIYWKFSTIQTLFFMFSKSSRLFESPYLGLHSKQTIIIAKTEKKRTINLAKMSDFKRKQHCTGFCFPIISTIYPRFSFLQTAKRSFSIQAKNNCYIAIKIQIQ